SIQDSIEKIKWHGDNDESDISSKIKTAMNEYADISLCLNLALLDLDVILNDTQETEQKELIPIRKMINGDADKVKLIERFRDSNLIRHNLVSWPLVNYTNYRGDLTEEELYKNISELDIELVKSKKSKTPRFIHADEYQLFYLIRSLKKKE
ncbi:reverse transcriptase, partial [Salmonella enterica subsp. enterica serovar Kentucky]|nr:reverse transcriptase [Salmonella enterica subsp. enterica serovar Kentucky]